MISLDFSALSKIDSQHGISKIDFVRDEQKILEFLKKIKNRNQGFYTPEVLEDEETIAKIEDFTKSVEGKYDDIVLLGIGGSSLGPIALRDALVSSGQKNTPNLHVLDNIDPDLILECEEKIDFTKTLFLVVTKSGGTPETLSQYFYFSKKIQEKGLDEKKHLVFVTDPESGFLREEANKKGIVTFSIPPNVGGRFSVQTAVGLLPAALLGIDIRDFLTGIKLMAQKFLSEDFEVNLPFQLATVQMQLFQKGKSQNVTYSYSNKLFRVADWFRQLLAESTGKRFLESGEEVFTGIAPVNALGATDHHSQNQLYMEGPNDKFFIFFEVGHFKKKLSISFPHEFLNDERVNFLKNTNFEDLIKIEKKSCADSLTKNNRPHITILFPEVSAFHIGEVFMLFEGATAFLGEFLNINAFDQPGVEMAKILTKKYLLS